MSVFSVFAHLVERLADLLAPLFHGSATAAAIVVFTALVRLLVHPLSRAAARGQRARAALQPKIAALREKHGEDPQRLRRAVLELHTEEQVSPLSGLLPGLLQLPAFFLLYRLFSGGGASDGLLSHRLLAAPLGGRWADALGDGGVFGPAGLVYLGLFALVAAVAAVNFRRTKRMTATGPAAIGDEQLPGLGAVNRVMPFLSFLTLVTVAVVPLAAALYVVTSTTWSALERAALYR
ncbi:YidC/Oxa1 family membrane protein insertase [Streptomyces sp. 1222.5]|uniref:membrane protein insertase YidC n=1 Tax=unclassified Streptomyces TaxID=2593676 RepID=UPI00089942C5|nr:MULTISPECIES: membrane protein insertase YidC [unclassified Streptomyces]PKW08053.1 YidC/Oxa1 family membrane protein insertase [Streptomyces sp. 5112.2]SEC73223.1 YidC/Oxa1 family membrane protein insertase [Streptomyces sp. 1222.5]